MKLIGVIPARYASSRLPGKMLLRAAGKSLVQHTYENARRCPCLDELWIATDDPRIDEEARSFGAPSLLSPSTLRSGTERIAYLIDQGALPPDALYINIQGDEPHLASSSLAALAALLRRHPTAVATLVTPLAAELSARPSVVKCVRDPDGRALYFSRSAIPHRRHEDAAITYWRHLGVYGYSGATLLAILRLEDTPLQRCEDLEQLKFIEHGYTIMTAEVADFGIGIDTPEDMEAFQRLLCNASTSSSREASVPLSAKDSPRQP